MARHQAARSAGSGIGFAGRLRVLICLAPDHDGVIQITMRPALIRTAAYTLASLWTIAYAFILYAETWVSCYGTHPLCEAGWLPRTWITAGYLAILAGFLWLVRWAHRSAVANTARRGDGGI